MKRTIFLVTGTTLLCLGALAVWAYAKRTGSEGSRSSESESQITQPEPKSSVSAEKRAIDPAVYALPVNFGTLNGGKFSVCYVDTNTMTLYPWKAVALRYEQLSEGDRSPLGGRRPLDEKAFTTVAPIDALVKYRETPGGYRPGFFDHSAHLFYEWKGVVLKKTELLDKSQDGKDPLLDQRNPIEIIEIDMPAHLKKQPQLWKKNS